MKPDQVEPMLAEHAMAILRQILASKTRLARYAAALDDAVWHVGIFIEPVENRRFGSLPQIQRDIVAVLRDRDGFLTTDRITLALAEMVPTTNREYADCTVKMHLAQMVKAKLIGNRRKSPRGYFLIRD